MSAKGPCHDCGHSHPTMASASRRGEQRWFCHADDHSCYNERRGRHFDDEPRPSLRALLNVPKELDDGPLWEEVARLERKRFLEQVRRFNREWRGNTEIPPTFSATHKGTP